MKNGVRVKQRPDILGMLAEHACERVAKAKERCSLEELQKLCDALTEKDAGKAFYEAVSHTGLSFICEIKRASPSKGLIANDFDPIGIVHEYEKAEADAVSCLTEPRWFLGSDEIFMQVRAETGLPMLRKDFIVDDYQIYEARLMGANCVLLICSLLKESTLARMMALCDTLGLAAIVEAHDEEEVYMALASGARMVGVNNRNLRDFTVDFKNASRWRQLVGDSALYIAESGVKDEQDIAKLAAIGADAVLIGEALMRAHDKADLLARLRKAAQSA